MEVLFWPFFALLTNGKRCSQEGSRPCYSLSQVVYAYHVLSLLLFFEPNIKTEMGVVIFMYLKHSLNYIDSKYMWVHGSNSLGSSVSAEIPFFAFFSLHRERTRNGLVGPSPCSSKGFSGQNTIFWLFFHYCGNHFLAFFLAHILSSVKIYLHSKCQRNPPTGSAKMMVQTYRQGLEGGTGARGRYGGLEGDTGVRGRYRG